MSTPDAPVLGLIAGEGSLPLAAARGGRRAGHRLVAVAFHGRTDPALADEVDELHWIHPGEVLEGLAAFRRSGVSLAVMAGKVGKADLVQRPESLHLDATARHLLAELADRGDAAVLARVADFLSAAGIELLPQWALAPELRVGPGPLGKGSPTPSQQADIAYALPIAKAVAALDVGQTVVVKDRAVLAIEAIEGTDAALRRAGALASGGVAVKVSKPGQDPRFDVPAVGPRTLAVAAEAAIAVFAFEAAATLVLEREVLVREADAAGIAVLGVAMDSEEG